MLMGLQRKHAIFEAPVALQAIWRHSSSGNIFEADNTEQTDPSFVLLDPVLIAGFYLQTDSSFSLPHEYVHVDYNIYVSAC